MFINICIQFHLQKTLLRQKQKLRSNCLGIDPSIWTPILNNLHANKHFYGKYRRIALVISHGKNVKNGKLFVAVAQIFNILLFKN